jgi:Na+/H+-translocating membrane pyrophosphatase
LTPLLLGISFGPSIIAGLLLGVIISGLQLATSSANSGAAWEGAKKYIEEGHFVDQ